MYIIGTAGHVDHGKSALVLALTGIDPDRLPEEKKREMTIDLGFAWLTLPSGREVSIVDVPGHEKFIKNMLAGVGGIDFAILVIAADEGVMPQTKEHLAILDLLGLEHGIIVITKKDLVDEETQELASLEAVEVTKGTSLEAAPIVIASAVTGEGLPELLTGIDRLLDNVPQHRDVNKPRLSIDRIFVMKGFGTVVTGTLINGKLFVGQEIEILPIRRRANIRGLQTHKHEIDAALPGSRVAVNLAGVSADMLERGFVITTPGWLRPTRIVDVKFNALSGLPEVVKHNAVVTLHTRAIEVAGKLRLLDKEALYPGESGWGQVVLSKPIAAVKGDHYILRSAEGTIGGGEIIDPYAKRHRRFSSSIVDGLVSRGGGSPEESFLAILKAGEPAEFGRISNLSGLSLEEAQKVLNKLVSDDRVVKLGEDGPYALLLSMEFWNELLDTAKRIAQEYHHQYPLRKGMLKEELRNRLKIKSQHFKSILRELIERGVLAEEDALVKLPSHEINFTGENRAETEIFLKTLAESPYIAPNKVTLEPEIIDILVDEQQVVRATSDVIFLSSAYDEMVGQIISYLKQKGKITVARARDMLETNRRSAQGLLEYLDEQNITRRIGDTHVLYLEANFHKQPDKIRNKTS